MGGEKRIVRVPKSTINDNERGLILHRGVFIKGSPEFFEKYGREVQKPTKPHKEKIHGPVREIRDAEWQKIARKLPSETGQVDETRAGSSVEDDDDEAEVEVEVEETEDDEDDEEEAPAPKRTAPKKAPAKKAGAKKAGKRK